MTRPARPGQPGRRPARRRRPRRPAQPLTWRRFGAGVWQLLPNLLGYFGTLGLIVTAFGLGPAVAAHDQNVELHRIGVRATAEVVSVRKQHHHGRHSSWDEWIPTTQQTVDGWSSTTELERYSSRDEDAFHRGQRFAVLVDPGDRDSVVPASDAARDRNTRALHRSVGGGDQQRGLPGRRRAGGGAPSATRPEAAAASGEGRSAEGACACDAGEGRTGLNSDGAEPGQS
ncbi:hypothetical protein [Curtobacterium sp. MCPF17_052]|uniref:hypothetical protein n=1 Tax=Curtobacterium sp. MCPF17_052 TaxID=2175655 RepID=UPI0024DF3646|nr:hypothetical protein [Curtobacterium sp. MCPF17_052]WIB12285.1 hypothetical protein DEJ36_16455 [Curtobacterium sp. MCPF17_052]